jgi:serine/threonine protein kinase
MTITKIHRYEIKSHLGAGGMASVYHAYDPSFERDVAIKVLPESLLLDPQFRTRFTREAKAIARLEHPAIVPVYDVGEDNNQPYIVMRYMAGGSLADRIKKGTLPLDECIQIINRLAPALDAAHKQGIIHRDLKPGNILFDQYGNSFLSDFGIARIGQAEGPALTGNFILGTPAYMSPEQARGEADIDGRSDIYSLGSTLYEMLCGKITYEADTPMGQALKQIMEPTPNILEIRPDLPIEVQDVLAKSMEKDRSARYSTAAEMADALNSIIVLKPTIITPIPAVEQTIAVASTSQVDRSSDATLKPQPLIVTPTTTATSEQPARKNNLVIFGVIAVILVLILAVAAIWILPRLGGTPTSPSDEPQNTSEIGVVPLDETQEPTATNQLTNTPETTPTSQPEEPTPTEAGQITPTLTVEASPTPPLVGAAVGGADKIAYLIENDIWTANVDGSDPLQITRDGIEKTNLLWTPDASLLLFISGKCLRGINIDTSEISDIACYKYVKSFSDFDITDDGKKLALSLNNQLFIVPFDIPVLLESNTNEKLTAIAECKDFAPYVKNAVKGVEWSSDGNELAIQIIGVLDDGRQGDIVQIIPVDQCIPNPKPLDNFPAPRFDIPEFADNPTIQRLSWDGVGLFVLTTYVRNRVYGNLYFYNSEIRQGWLGNPIEGKCCYTDPIWSPDGNYLFFTFQDAKLGTASQNQFFYVSYFDIEGKGQFTPLELPAVTDLRTTIEPALRPVPK